MFLLFGVAAVITGFVALCLLFFQATRKTYPGFGYWTAGVGFLALGYLLYALRGQIPLWCTVFLGNYAFSLGMVLHLDGIRRFLGLKPASRLWYALPLAVLAGLALFYFPWDSPTWRGLVGAIPLTSIHWTMASLIFRKAIRPRSVFYKVIGSLLSFAGLLILVRSVWLVSSPNADLLFKAPIEFAFFTAFIVLHLGENLSLILLNAERVESELVESEERLRLSVERLQESLVEQNQAQAALQKSEERYRTVAEHTYAWEYWVAPDGRLEYCSPSCERITGYKAAEFISDPDLLNRIVHSDDAAIWGQHLLTVSETSDERELEYRIIHRDGRVVWMAHFCSPVYSAEGSYLGRRVSNRNITDRKNAEEEREAARSQLLLAQKMEAIGTLTGGIAHDFNNLLTIINGYTEMILMERKEDDPIYEDLKKILATGLKGADMVQRLLSFTKQSATRLEPIDLNHRIEESRKLMDRSFPKTIEIETILSDDPGMVNADAGQMDQLLMNLCVNAKDAMPDGGCLRIETRNVTVDEDYCRLHVGAKPGRYVVVEVSDTGVGMSRETMDRIFDPFFTTKGWDYKKGTGLGLSVAKGIVEQHGGWITCESELGRGTTFRVYFPAAEEKPVMEQHQPLEATVQGSERILLVDDEEYVRDLGRRILEGAGYEVITASNGKEALDIYATDQSKFGLVVLDLVMPQMSGEKCLEELIKLNPHVKVLVSTGHSLDARERLHVGTLAKGFVNKPYEVRQLVQAVKKVLETGGFAE